MKQTIDTLLARLRMKQLQLLIALDEHKSMHKAASALSITQSAASKVLHELEDMFDTPLFERSKSGMIPNPFGHSVIRHAGLLVTDLGALGQDIADIRTGKGGRLATGTIMGAVPDVVVPILNWLHTRQPNLASEVVEDTSIRMLSLLDDGRLDLVIGRASVAADVGKYLYQPLRDEPVSVVVGYHHPQMDADNLGLRHLENHRWLVYPPHMPMHTLLEREMDAAGMTMPGNQISTASTFVSIAILQRSNDIVALLPTDVADFFARHKMLRILPIELASTYQTFGIVTRKGAAMSPAADQFIQRLRGRNMVH